MMTHEVSGQKEAGMLRGDLILLDTFLKRLMDSIPLGGVKEQDPRQRVIYLLQKAGVDLGYTFGWGLYGPYSTDLAGDLYTLNERKRLGLEPYWWADEKRRRTLRERTWSEPVEKALQRTGELIEPPPWVSLPHVEWVELISSLCFLSGFHRGSSTDQEEEVVGDWLKRRPTLVSSDVVYIAYDHLCKWRAMCP